MSLKQAKLLIILLATISVFSQEKSFVQGINPFDSNYFSATLYLRDGSTIDGFAKIRKKSIPQSILFKQEQFSDTKKKYNHKQVKYVIFRHNEDEEKHEYKIVKNNGLADIGDILLLRNLVDDKLKLYYRNDPLGQSRFPEFYYSDNTDNFVQRIGHNVRTVEFKKFARELFGDCLELYEKIMKEHFDKYGVEDVFMFYQNQCSTK